MYVDPENFVVYVSVCQSAVEFAKTSKTDKYASYYAPVFKSKFNTVRDANRMRYKKEIIIDLAPFSTRQKPPGAEALSEDSHTVFH